MAFREKMAWITACAHVLVFGGYFLAFLRAWDDGHGLGLSLGLMIGAVVTLVILMVASAIVAAVLSPKEANAPADERERLIDLKAERLAAYVLSVCVVLLIGALLANLNGYLVANLLLAAMVVAEIAKAATRIALYRAAI